MMLFEVVVIGELKDAVPEIEHPPAAAAAMAGPLAPNPAPAAMRDSANPVLIARWNNMHILPDSIRDPAIPHGTEPPCSGPAATLDADANTTAPMSS